MGQYRAMEAQLAAATSRVVGILKTYFKVWQLVSERFQKHNVLYKIIADVYIFNAYTKNTFLNHKNPK